MEVTNMYVEAASRGNTALASTQPAIQIAEVEPAIHAQSTDREAEYTAKETTAAENEDTSQTPAELQSAEKEKLKKAIEKMNEQLPNSEAKFGIHEATNRVMIKLVDKDTQEVIKEIPPEKTLDMIAKCMEIAGVLVDAKL